MSRDIDDEVRCYRLANGNCPLCARPRHDGMTCDYARGKADELAKVVMLIRNAYHPTSIPGRAATQIADALERGEHKK